MLVVGRMFMAIDSYVYVYVGMCKIKKCGAS